jgi:RNA polymerase-binding transcription factor DksA
VGIDISQLPPEKRAFLEANPDFLKSLEQEIPKQVSRFLSRKLKENKGKSEWQREIEEAEAKAEEARRMAENLQLELLLNLPSHLRGFSNPVQNKFLICPECGQGDSGNRLNGKPWCFKCYSPLVPMDKLERWKRLPKIRVLPKDLKDELKRLNPGLNPEGDEE